MRKEPYDDIPDSFEIRSCLSCTSDVSSVYLIKQLHQKAKQKSDNSPSSFSAIFQDDDFISSTVMLTQAYDFLQAANVLLSNVRDARKPYCENPYINPCAYCCRHAVELMIKHCALAKGIAHNKLTHHNLADLWAILDETSIPQYNKLTNYIRELDTIDKNGTALRYGLDTSFQLPSEDFAFNIDVLVANAKYLFKILRHHVAIPHASGECS